MQAHDEQGRLRRAFARPAVAVLVFAGWIAGGFGGETATKTGDDAATVAAALVACVLCARSALRSEGRVRLFWSLLAAACGAWTLGETIWGLYDLDRKSTRLNSS